MTLYSYEIGETFTASGTVSITSGSAISGSGTSFATEFAPGYLVTIGSETRVVSGVSSSSAMSVSAAFTQTLSGQVAAGADMINVELLPTPVTPPKSKFFPWQETVDLQSGLTRALGKPRTDWVWGVLGRAMRDQMRTFCLGKSSNVVIRSRKNDTADSYVYYRAVMNWPDEEDRQAGRRLDFTIPFTFLTAITVS